MRQLNTENGDYDLTSQQTVLTHTPDASNPCKCMVIVYFGDGIKDLDGSGGDFELTIQIGSQVVQPDPQTIEFSTAVRSVCFTVDFGVPANEQVLVKVKSPNGADTDVDVTAYLYDVGTVQPTIRGNTLDVSATGEAGLDFNNVKDATVAHTLTNITVPNVTEAYLGNGAHGGVAATLTLSGYSNFKATGFSTLDAAGVRAAVGLASANLDTQLSGLSTYVNCLPETLDGSTFTNMPAGTLTSDERNSVADAVLQRDVDNIEASANEHTLCTIILAALESSVSGTTWTIKRTDGSTTHATKTITSDEDANPITGVS